MNDQDLPHPFRFTLVHNGEDARQKIHAVRSQGLRVGLVPTMGALHAGHLSLVQTAKAECQHVVVSIFVNPTQFGPSEDFSKYPRTLSSDFGKLHAAGADLVFCPSADEIYPPGFSTYIQPPAVAALFEGVHRPDHFRGVCTIVLKLFQLLPADLAYFGQKDYQQAVVIHQMVTDLNLPIYIRACPTIREPDGLALSSRNVYLSADERKQALAISRSLQLAADSVDRGERDATTIIRLVEDVLRSAGITHIDYVAIADPDTLVPAQRIESPKRLLIAARVGHTRLIDNCQIG